MSCFKIIFVTLCFTIVFCESAFVDTVEKCDYKDNECLTKLINGVFVKISKTGIPEYDISPIDPYEIKNAIWNILNVVDLTLIEGTIKGLKNCQAHDLKLNMDKGHFKVKILCDNLTAKGKYEVTGSSPALKELFGGTSVSGGGNAKLLIEKVLIKFDFRFDLIRGADGEIYFEFKKDLATYDFDLLGGSKLQLDKLYIGDVESSQLITNYYNENAKTLWKSFGRSILDQIMGSVYDTLHKLIKSLPAKYIISGDVTQFVKE